MTALGVATCALWHSSVDFPRQQGQNVDESRQPQLAIQTSRLNSVPPLEGIRCEFPEIEEETLFSLSHTQMGSNFSEEGAKQ